MSAPTASVYKFSTQPQAAACQPLVDAALGFPAVSVDVGPAPINGPAVTTTYSGVYSDGSNFGYPIDANTTPALTGHIILSSTLPGAAFVRVA